MTENPPRNQYQAPREGQVNIRTFSQNVTKIEFSEILPARNTGRPLTQSELKDHTLSLTAERKIHL